MSTQKEETRARLLEAARKLLLERGFHRVSLDDIAEAAGVSRQAVYKSHFTSKANLLLELVRYVHVAENLDQFTAPVFAATTGVTKLHATIAAIIRIEVRVHDLAVMLSAAAMSDPGAEAAWRDRLHIKRTVLTAAIAQLHGERRLNPGWQPEAAVDLLMAMISVDTYHSLVAERGWEPEAMIERMWSICQQCLIVEPEACSAHPKTTRKIG